MIVFVTGALKTIDVTPLNDAVARLLKCVVAAIGLLKG